MIANVSRFFRNSRLMASLWLIASVGAVSAVSNGVLTNLLPESQMPELSSILDAAMTESDSMRIREISEELSLGTKKRLASVGGVKARASLSYRKERDISSSDDFGDRIFYNFVLTKSIYHWGAVKASRRRGEIANESARLISFDAYRSLALAIRSSYMELIVLAYEVRVAKMDLDLQESLLEKEATAVEEGNSAADRLTLAQDSRDRAALLVLEAESIFESELASFSFMTGVSSDSLRVSTSNAIPKLQLLEDDTLSRLTSSVDMALTTSSNLKRLERSAEDADQELALAQSSLKPKLNLESGFTQFDLDDRGVRREEELIYLGVGLSWSIWDGAESRGLAREARSRKELVRIQIDQARRSLDSDLQNARRSIEIAKFNLEIEEKFLARGEDVLAASEQKFEEKKISQRGLEGAQRGVLKQELKAMRARARYLNAVAELASLLGLDPAALKYIASREG